MPKINVADKLIYGMPWAILPEKLEQIEAIANREQGIRIDGLEAVEKELGRPLKNTRTVTQRGNTAIIPVTGPIFRYADFFTMMSGGATVEDLALDFNAALENKDVDTILLHIDSPGGMVTGIQELAAQIFDARGKKNIIAYAEHYMCSAAYWIGSAADKVLVNPTAIVGSIGVITSIKKDKGDTVQVVSKQSPMKNKSPETKEGMNALQTMIDDLGAVFTGDVAKYRGVSTDAVLKDFGGGGVFVGEKSIAAGLADGIASLEAIIEAANSGKPLQAKRTYQVTAEKPKAEEETPKMDITKEKIAAENPDIAEAFRAEGRAQANASAEAAKKEGIEAGKKEGLEAGAKAERERLSAIDSAFAGFECHSAIRDQLKADATATEATAHAKIVAAERDARTAASKDRKEDASTAVEGTKLTNVHKKDESAAEKTGPISMEDATKLYQSDAALQKEFTDAESYFYYRQNS